MKNYQIKVELTNKCNLNCIHCSSRASANQDKEFSLNLLKKIIADSRYIRSLVFTGGEPLLYSKLMQAIDISNSVGLYPIIYTSGIAGHLDLQFILDRLKGRIGKFIVSLHGPEFVHDRITKNVGSFKKTIDFINRAMDEGIPIGIHAVSLKENIQTLPQLVSWLNQKSLNEISILRFVPQGRGFDSEIKVPDEDEIKKLYEQLSAKNVRFGAPFNNLRSNKVRCKAGISTMSIDVYGRVMPCDSYKDLASFSSETNINNRRLIDIVQNSDLFKYARNNTRMMCNSECCLGQFLLAKHGLNIEKLLYG